MAFSALMLLVGQQKGHAATVSCFSKIQIGFTSLVLAHPGNLTQRAVKWVCVSDDFLYTNIINMTLQYCNAIFKSNCTNFFKI